MRRRFRFPPPPPVPLFVVELVAQAPALPGCQALDRRLSVEEGVSADVVAVDREGRLHLLLEVPMKPLCSDDCEGIAVPEHLRPPAEVFGASVPDARFAPLLKLKEQLTKKEE